MARKQSFGKWWFAQWCTALGAVTLIAALIGHRPAVGILSLFVLAGFGVGLSIAGGRESAVLLRGEGDERQRQIGREAAQVTMGITAPILVAGAVWESAHGYYGKFGMVCSLMGFVMIASLVVLGRRR